MFILIHIHFQYIYLLGTYCRQVFTGSPASDKTKKQEDSLPEGGWFLCAGGQQGLYKATVRDLALEGEGLRTGLKMKMILLFKAIQIEPKDTPRIIYLLA